jgi:predicted ATP-binding protein involved in virulence
MTEAQQEIRIKEQRESPKDYPPAYFLSIELENVLCFKARQKLDLSDNNGFPAQWTVILGDNGVGKTTLLRCLAGMQPAVQTGIMVPSMQEETFATPRLEDFRAFFDRAEVSQNSSAMVDATFTFGSSFSKRTDTEQRSMFLARYSNLSERITPSERIILLPTKMSTIWGYSSVDEELFGLKCYGYGANRRMGKTSLSEALSADSCASLFHDSETLINAEEWLLQADYAVARSTSKHKTRLEQRLSLIKEILKHLLPDVSDIRIASFDDNILPPIAKFRTPYGWVPLKNLSLGYKTVIAWTVDLAAKLMDRYPLSADPLAEPAVVLVDEIDLHLHPKWQRTIISFLSVRFPNTQFIVTAHSPLVVQAAKNANIVLLRREGDHVVIDNDPEIIDNWRVEQVLASVFELPSPHSPEIEPLIERRRKLLAKSKLTAKDERELKKLEEQIGTIPTAESPEDIRAMDIIRKAAKLLENS